jgi:hypothetical protein
MKKIFLALLLPSLAWADPSIYRIGDALPSSGVYGQLPACSGPSTIKAVACGDSGELKTTLSKTEAVFGAAGSIGSASLTGSYATVIDLPDTTVGVILDNQTDGDVWVSMDGGVTNHFHLAARDVVTINLATMGLKTTGVVKAKDGVSASTTGSFYVSSVK